MIRLPVYLLVRPLVEDRDVLDLRTGSGAGLEILLQGNPRQVFTLAEVKDPRPEVAHLGADPPLDLSAQSVDVVICPDLLDREPERRNVWLDEIVRVLRPQGFAVFVGRNPERPAYGEAGDGSPLDYWRLLKLVGEGFMNLATLAQAPASGYFLSYLEPAVEATELSLLDELCREPEAASHFVIIASSGALPEVDPYALVTLPYAEVFAGADALSARLASLQARLAAQQRALAEREAEVFRLAARSARVDRLEAEQERAVAQAADLKSQGDREISRLRSTVENQTLRTAAVQRELDDARRQIDDLVYRVTDAEAAATELALERDRALLESRGVIEGQQELAEECQRLRELYDSEHDTLTRTASSVGALQAEVERSALALDQAHEDLSRLASERTMLLEARAELEQRLNSAENELRDAERRIENLADVREELGRLRGAHEAMQRDLRRLTADREELRNLLAEAQKDQIDKQAVLVRLQAEAQAQLREGEHLREARDSLRAEVRDHEALIAVQNARMDDLRELLLAKAVAFKAAEAELAHLGETLAVERRRTEELQAALDEQRSDHRQKSDALLHQDERSQALRGELDRLREARAEADKRAAALEIELAASAKEVELLGVQLADRRRRIDELEQERKEQKDRLDRREATIDTLRQRGEELKRDLSAAELASNELQARMGQWAERGRLLANIAQERDQLRQQLGDRLAELYEAERRATEALSDRNEYETRCEGLELRLQDVDTELGRRRARAEELERQLAELHPRISELTGQLSARDEELHRLNKRLDDLLLQGTEAADLQGELKARGQQAKALSAELERSREELQRARRDLTAQAEEAERIKGVEAALREQLAAKESEAAAHEALLDQQRREQVALREELAGVKAIRKELARAVEQANQQAEESDAELRRIRGDHAALEREHGRVQQAEEMLRPQIEAARGETRALEAELTSIREALSELRLQLAEAQGKEERGQRDVAELERLLAEAREQAVTVNQQHAQEIGDLRLELEALQERSLGDRRRQELEIDVRAGELEVAMRQLEDLEGTAWLANDEATRHAAEVAAAAAAAAKEKEGAEAAKEALAEVQAQASGLRKQIDAAEEERDLARTEYRRVHEELANLRKELLGARQRAVELQEESARSAREVQDAKTARQRAIARAEYADRRQKEVERELAKLRRDALEAPGGRASVEAKTEAPTRHVAAGEEVTRVGADRPKRSSRRITGPWQRMVDSHRADAVDTGDIASRLARLTTPLLNHQPMSDEEEEAWREFERGAPSEPGPGQTAAGLPAIKRSGLTPGPMKAATRTPELPGVHAEKKRPTAAGLPEVKQSGLTPVPLPAIDDPDSGEPSAGAKGAGWSLEVDGGPRTLKEDRRPAEVGDESLGLGPDDETAVNPAPSPDAEVARAALLVKELVEEDDDG